MKNNLNATIVMPIYNGATTLDEVLASIEMQNDKNLIDEIIFINDNSSDSSQNILKSYVKVSSYKCKIIKNTSNIGLANGYNHGIKISKSQIVITMHQDIVLKDTQSFAKILKPFLTNKNITASYPILDHPRIVWNTYNFWQKAMFSRFLDRKVPILSGKFDAFRKKDLKSVGYFDSERYRTAGEDGDLKRKFDAKGYVTENSNLEVVHIHNREPNFGIRQYIKKDVQIAEAQGVILRIHGIKSFKNFIFAFFRQILVVSLLVPGINIFSILLIVSYSIMYGKNVLKQKKVSFLSILLPITNIYILFLSTVYSIRGFIMQRQRL